MFGIIIYEYDTPIGVSGPFLSELAAVMFWNEWIGKGTTYKIVEWFKG
jgi:hypothetical protein